MSDEAFDVESERARLLAEIDALPEGAELDDDQTRRLLLIAAADRGRPLDPYQQALAEAVRRFDPDPSGAALLVRERPGSDALDVIRDGAVIGVVSRSALDERAAAIERGRRRLD